MGLSDPNSEPQDAEDAKITQRTQKKTKILGKYVSGPLVASANSY